MSDEVPTTTRHSTGSIIEATPRRKRPEDHLNSPCAESDPQDAKLPGAIATIGVLAAVACIGFWPSGGPLLCLIVSLTAGLLLVPSLSFTLPTFCTMDDASN
jgi:hypothetical protein